MTSPRPALAALLLLLLGVSQAAAQAKLTVSKLPIPADADRTQALALIQDVYKQEYEAAKTDIQKVELAKKLLTDAQATRSSPTNRYVLLRVAKDIAGGVGHLETAYEAIDLLDAEFAVDPLQLKAEALVSSAKAAKLPSHYQALAPEFVALITGALAADRYDIPAGLKDTATNAARSARDGTLTKTVLDALARSEEQQQAFAAIQPALATLEVQPADPAANLAVGKFQCLVKGNWTAGVPMLALGSDAGLREAALAELRGGAKPPDPHALGDEWWAQAETQTGDTRHQLQQRAAHWYFTALDSLQGLPREQVRKRLLEIQSSSGGLKFPAGAVVVFTFETADFSQQGNNLLLKDRSDQGNHGFVSNPEVVPGKVGDGLDVIGDKRAYIDCQNTPSLNPTDAITVCAWVNLQKPSGWHTHYFISKEDWQKGARGFVLRGAPGNLFLFAIGDASNWHAVEANAELKLNEWQHIAATYDGETMTLYLNGVASGTKNVKAKIEPSPFKLRIGRNDSAPNRFMTGLIDEVAVFARALSADEIRTIYQIGQLGQSIGE